LTGHLAKLGATAAVKRQKAIDKAGLANRAITKA
jgi:hypothetical protein